MNKKQSLETINHASGAAIGFVLAVLIFIAAIIAVKISIHSPAIDADRDNAIAKSLADIRSNEVVQLDNAGWIDQQRGIVRLPIGAALQIAIREWQNPAQARADLIARAEKANAPLPKQPAKPNPFE